MIIAEYQKIVATVADNERNINDMLESGVPMFVFNPRTMQFKRLNCRNYVEWNGNGEYRLFSSKDANKFTLVYPHNLFIYYGKPEWL